MKKGILGLALTLSLLGAVGATAQQHKEAKKGRRLADTQLDRITAGNADAGSSGQDLGGAIVAGGSEATITNSGSVTLEDGTQKGAEALNLVNSSQSRVANGVNVWDGQLDSTKGATKLNVDQTNQVVQQGFATYSSLEAYKRTDANVATTRSTTETSDSSSTDSFTNDSMVDTKQSVSSAGGSSSVGDLESPSPGVDVQAGQGISGTGKMDIHVDAGAINVGVGGSASATTQTATNVGKVVDGKVTSTVSAKYNVDLNWDLPKLDLSFDGGICYVELGSCSAKGSRDSNSDSKSERTTDYSQTTHAPVSIENAKAEYVVVDESKLTAKTDYAVLLSGDAQSNTKALNLVNAAGSLITNAVNVARTPTVGPVLNLNQSNVIVQQH